ncbi:MAG TPA: PLP-dependent aminotransferase family protein [Anaerolineae bacterium]
MSDLKPINFTRGIPAVESFPIDDMIDAAAAALKQHGSTLMQYGPSLGFAPLREWLAQQHRVEPNQVMLGNGSLQLLEFLSLLMIQPGDIVFTESPSYDRAITLLKRRGAEVIGIPLESDGPDLDALEGQLHHHVPRFFYLVPDFQNPSGVTCSAEKRRRIIDLAERYNFLLVEDSPYRHLRYRGTDEPLLFRLAPHRVLLMSSFSKLISPGMRVGFVMGDHELLAKIAKIAEDTYITPNVLAHGIAYEWCRRGCMKPQIEKLKALYVPRLEACLAALEKHMPDAQAVRPEGGFFVSVILPPPAPSKWVRIAAARHQLNLADGLAFFPDGGGEHFVRLPFCALTPEEIDEGIQRLAMSVQEVSRQAETV